MINEALRTMQKCTDNTCHSDTAKYTPFLFWNSYSLCIS